MELSDTAIEMIMSYRKAFNEWIDGEIDSSEESTLRLERYIKARNDLAMIISLEYGE